MLAQFRRVGNILAMLLARRLSSEQKLDCELVTDVVSRVMNVGRGDQPELAETFAKWPVEDWIFPPQSGWFSLLVKTCC